MDLNIILSCVAAILLCLLIASLVQKKPMMAVAQDLIPGLDRVWLWLLPRLTNKSMWMAMVANIPLYWPQIAGDPMVQAFLARHPALYMAGALVALMASRQHGTPRALPPPLSPTGGYVNNVAIA